MKNYFKPACQLLGVLLAATLFVGCGGSSSQNIKIGGVFEMSGNTAAYGTAAANGMKLAFKEINAKGGVLGKQLEPIITDCKGEPSESANATTKVITQDKVPAVIGFTTSSNGIAGATVAEASKIPMLQVTTTNPKVTVDEKTGKVRDNVFRVCFIDPFQGTVAANFASKTLKVSKVVTLVDNSSDYSKGLTQFFVESFIKSGGKIVAQEAYLQKDQDFKAILTKIKPLNPDMIYVPGYYDEVGKIIKQARELGITATFVGGDGWDSPKLFEIAGAANLNNTFFTNHYSPEDKDARVVAFVEAYKKEYGVVPEANAALAYDAAYLMTDAIKRAGAVDSPKIREALAATKNFKGVTGEVSLNATHDAVKNAVIIELKDGKQVFRETVKP